MKGLDTYIMGLNDPNAPFNQTEWTEHFCEVLEHCDWVDDKILSDPILEEKLCNIFTQIAESFYEDRWYPPKERFKILRDNAKSIAEKAKELFYR